MEQAVNLIEQIGQFAGLVIVVCVVVMLLVSLVERNPPRDEKRSE